MLLLFLLIVINICNTICVTWCMMMVAKHFYVEISAFWLFNMYVNINGNVNNIEDNVF